MAGHRKWQEIRRPTPPDVAEQVRAERDAELAAYASLMDHLRQAHRLTRAQLAHTNGRTDADLDRLDRDTDLVLGTLTRFFNALGGDLELRASFQGHEFEVALEDIFGLAPPADAAAEAAPPERHVAD